MQVGQSNGRSNGHDKDSATVDLAEAKRLNVIAAQAALEADRKAREDACLAELATLLERHRCEILPEVTIGRGGVTAIARIVAK